MSDLVERLRKCAEQGTPWTRAKLLLEAADRIEELEAGWISVEDRLPKPFVQVLLRSFGEGRKHYIYELGHWVESDIRAGRFQCTAYGDQVSGVVEWMPLPQPPDNTEET